MPQTRTCPRGHEWDGDPADCPGCADDSWNQSAGSTFSDELPPPPRSGRTASMPIANKAGVPQSANLPAIPGYELLDELGRGGMGVVYRARQLSLNRLVALKVIARDESRERMRFRLEAESIGRLQHPNIVQVHEIGESDGREYFAMELVPGGTLAQALVNNPLDTRAAAALLEILARAVEYAHSQGIIHRDLKPGNILVTGADSGAGQLPFLIPKIADFGLAKRIGVDSSQTTTGVVVGTPSYMAPEQAAGLGNLIGPACDVYALGAILYELLTGRPPFRAASPVETLQQVMAIDPVAPARLQPGVPRDLETICLTCLAKEARKRYASAAALADDLRRFLDGKPILARRTPIWERTLKWARRRPAAAALLIVSALSAIALTGLGVRYFRILERHNIELTKAATDLARERDLARSQSERAELNLESANEAIEQMLKRVGVDRLQSTPFMDRTRADLLEDALRFFDRLLARQAGDPRLRLQRAHTLMWAGQVQFTLGRLDLARERYDAALALTDELQSDAESSIPIATLRYLRAAVLNSRSLIFVRTGDFTTARRDQEAAVTLREQLLNAEPTNPEYEFQVAASNLNLALIARGEHKMTEVELFHGRARPHAEALTRDHPEEDRYWYLLGLALNDSAVYALEVDDTERVDPFLERAIEIWRKLCARAPGDVEYRLELARSLTNLGTAQRKQGYLKKAGTSLQEALQLREPFARDHPDVWAAVLGLASTRLQMAELQLARNDRNAALQGYTMVMQTLETAGDQWKSDANAKSIMADAHIGRANALGAAGKYDDMAQALSRAIELAEPHRTLDLRMSRALALSYAGKNSAAIKEAEDILAADGLNMSVLFDGARLFARVAGLGKDRERKEQLAGRAVVLLQMAAKGGYFRKAAHRVYLDQHVDFTALRERDDFRSLRAKIGG